MQPFEPGSAPQAPFDPSRAAQWQPAVPPLAQARHAERGWPRPIAAAATFFLLLAIAASAVVLMPGGTKEPEAGSPEAVVMAWWQAERDGNQDGIAGVYLTATMRGRYDADLYGMLASSSSHVAIESSSVNGEQATVRATFSVDTGVAAPGLSAELPVTFILVTQDGAWKIDDIQSSLNF